MKKMCRLLLLLLAMALVVTLVAVGVMATDAEATSAEELEAPWQYVNTSGETLTTSSLSTALSGAKEGSTVKLLSDTTIVTGTSSNSFASVSKALTIDLGGHTWRISQSGKEFFSVSTTAGFTVQNGTIIASGNSSYGASGVGYNVFRPGKAGVTITLNNLKTYTASLVQDGWAGNVTVNINGGEHYLAYSATNLYGGGLVETRRNATVTVTGAKIYPSNNASVMNSLIYGAVAGNNGGTAPYSNYTFVDCEIISYQEKAGVIGNANEYTSVVFDGCNIYGAINPTLGNDDIKAGVSPIKAGAITLKNGTKLGHSSSQKVDESLFSADSTSVGIYDVVSYAIEKPVGNMYYDVTNGTVADISFATQSDEVTVAFLKAFGDATDYPFAYNIGNHEFLTNDFNTAVSSAESYIKINGDYTLEIDTGDIQTINKNLTIDLNGTVFKVKENSEEMFRIGEGAKVSLVNGTLVKRGTKVTASTSAVFSFVGDNAGLVVENVNVVAGALVYNGGYKGVSVSINGGSFNGMTGSTTEWGGFIESHSEITFTAKDATFITDDNSYLFSLGSKSSEDGESNITLKNCKIVATPSSKNDPSMYDIVRYANSDTKITIDGGYVYGIINPTLHESDAKSAIGKGAILVKSGTVFSTPTSNIGGDVIKIPSSCVYNATDLTDTAYYYSYTGSSQFKTLTYSYTIGAPDASAVVSYVSGGIVVAGNDFKSAIPLAEANTTVTLLKTITLTESEKGFLSFTKPITLDLNGYALELIQEGEAHIYVKADVTIKNGTLRAAMNENGPYAGRSYPMLCYGISMKGLTINLENVNSYAGSLVFAWNCSDHTLNVVGGQHTALNRGTGNDNGWLDVRGNFNFNATDALFVSNANSQIISALSFKDTDGVNFDSVFTFNNCDLITENGTSTILGYSNENARYVFNNCDIYGSMRPSLQLEDEKAGFSAIGSGAIVLGEGTRFVGTNDITGGVIVPANGFIQANKVYKETIKYKSYTINSTTGRFTIVDKTISVTYLKQVSTYEDSLITVNFYKEDGKTLIDSFKVEYGATVTPPTYTAGESNGWFQASYNGWTTSVGSTEIVTSFNVTGDINYYPAVSGDIIPNLTAALYNLTLTGKVRNNLYIPVAPEGIKVIGVYDASGKEIKGQKVVFNGSDDVYTLYIMGEVGAAELTKATTISVKFTVLGVEYTQNISLSPSQYATAILKDSVSATPSFTSVSHTLVADLVRYSNSLCYVVNGEEDSVLAELLAKYPNALSDLPSNNAFANYVTNTTGIAGIVASVQLEVSSTEPRWIFNIANGVNVKSIVISTEGYLPTVVDGVNFGKLTYQTTKSSDGKTFYTENIPMYNLDRVLDIEVTLDDGTVKRATYNLDAYYKGFSEEGGRYTAVRDFLRSFRAFAASSSGYKYGTEIIKEGGIVDFFECDHEHLGAFVTGKGRLCTDCATYIFYYSDFGAVADGVTNRALTASGTNDFDAIYACHKTANNWSFMGAKVAVSAVGGAHNRTNYYIGAPTDSLTIDIQTDVLWRGANLIIDDRAVSQTRGDFYIPVFTVSRDASNPAVDYTSSFTTAIGPTSTNVGFAPGVPTMLRIVDKTIRHYIRYGANANSGDEQSEMLIVDEYGNISRTTIPEWSYIEGRFCKSGCTAVDTNGDNKCDTCSTALSSSVRITGYSTTEKPIRISGLDKEGNIAFTWENVTDDQVSALKYDQCQRTIKVSRSNVTVEGLYHYFTEDDTNTTARQAYSGIVNVSYAENVVIKDMSVTNHLGHYVKNADGSNTTTSLGSYEFSGGDSVNISWVNCYTRNLFNSNGSITYRGLFGTNRIRNMYLKDCVLNSFDAHSGANNVTIEDSVFEHINYIGAGDIVLKNVTVYTTTSYKTIAILRQDYGGTWNGNMYVDGVRARYTASDAPAYIDIIKSYYTNHYFGYSTYLPENIYINNVVTEGYSRTSPDYVFKDGTLEENITKTNAVPIGIHKHLSSMLTSHYDYSTVNANNANPRICTKNVYITNVSCGISYPDHPFFKGMKVYIDGVEKTDWYTQRSSIKCTDRNGDFVCDTCTANITCSATHLTEGCSTQTCSTCKATVASTAKCKDLDGNKVCETCTANITCSATHPASGDTTASCSTCKATISATSSGDSDNCVTGDTYVMLADGTQVRIDELIGDELVMVFDHFTGKLVGMPIVVYENDGIDEYEVVDLVFSDGTETSLIDEHGYFDLTLGKYVYLHADDAENYIGHEFARVSNNGDVSVVTLASVSVEVRKDSCYSIATAYQYNYIVDGMLSMPGGIEGLFNIFMYDDNLVYNEEKMREDIEKYGLYTYEDLDEYVDKLAFEIFNAKYFKVAVGKGMITLDKIVSYIEKYL